MPKHIIFSTPQIQIRFCSKWHQQQQPKQQQNDYCITNKQTPNRNINIIYRNWSRKYFINIHCLVSCQPSQRVWRCCGFCTNHALKLIWPTVLMEKDQMSCKASCTFRHWLGFSNFLRVTLLFYDDHYEPKRIAYLKQILKYIKNHVSWFFSFQILN